MNMPDNVNLKELWGRQAGTMPDTKEIFAKANRYKKKHLLKLLFTNGLLALTTAYITWIIIHYQPAMPSTRIGALLVIMAMIIYLLAYNRMIPLLLKANNNNNVNEYLKNLLKLNVKQKFLQTTMMNLYFILLSAGMFLYLIEFTLRMKLLWGILTYVLTFGWVVFSWFYFRAKAIRKQQKTMNELIEKFENLSKQLET
jgi:hypothetical protein